MPQGVYDHSYRIIQWTPEEDQILIDNWSTKTYKELVQLLKDAGKNVCKSTIRNRLVALNIITEYGRGKRVTQDMLDFTYVHRDLQIRTLTRKFNERFNRKWSTFKMYRVLLDAKAERGHRLTAEEFTEDWVKLQSKFAEFEDQTAPIGWLWRWKRFNRTTTEGAVFRGRKEPVGTIFNAEQFAEEWRKMQRMFGITT